MRGMAAYKDVPGCGLNRFDAGSLAIHILQLQGWPGRSLAAANVAYTLADSGRHILLLDMDLEAPGPQRFSGPAPGYSGPNASSTFPATPPLRG